MSGPPLPWRRLAGALCLLGLALSGAAEAFAHSADGLHGRRYAAQEELTSGCSRDHAPSFEPRLGSREVECPVCLLQVQQRGTAPAAGALATAPVMASALAPCEPAACVDRAGRHASPRGPPSLG